MSCSVETGLMSAAGVRIDDREVAILRDGGHDPLAGVLGIDLRQVGESHSERDIRRARRFPWRPTVPHVIR